RDHGRGQDGSVETCRAPICRSAPCGRYRDPAYASSLKTLLPNMLVVVGPTASGKTELGLRWAKEQDGEIISVDSRQVYRFLIIGTAKPEGQWHGKNYRVRGIPYHLIDLWDPADPFTAADFVRLATRKIHQIRDRRK